MREKELRLALVCYGGISLAVYMHGITKEIWRLARASRAFHDGVTPASGSQGVYRAMLQEIEDETGVRLRVLIDIIAGASAGGINGVFLAQAIATGQSLEPLTDLWFEKADIGMLLDPKAKAGHHFSKLWAWPVAWLAMGKDVDAMTMSVEAAARPEVRAKLSEFLRARWFSPPFGGAKFTATILDAFDAMAATTPGLRLLPEGQPLDLFVTVTDFRGHPERLRLNSPEEVVETEHRLTIEFNDTGSAGFADPAELTFAARSTASFPGAFPPFTVGELDAVLAERDRAWPTRDAFLKRTLPRQYAAGVAEHAVLIDGSVLANAPFRPAIEALRERPARRQIDRRFVYLDPFPDLKFGINGKTMKPPGFFATIIGAVSEIPREQPIRDNLEVIEAHSARIERMRGIIEQIRPEVEAQVEALFGYTLFLDYPTPARLKAWRTRAQAAAAKQAGFTYAAYAHLKIAGMIELLSALIAHARGAEGISDVVRIRRELETIIRERGADQVGGGTASEPMLALLRDCDLGFRIRRLRLVARRLGEIEIEGSDSALGPAREAIYASLSDYLECKRSDRYPVLSESGMATAALLDRLAAEMSLTKIGIATDQRLSDALSALPRDLRRPILLAYLGFPFFDVATLPLLQGEGLDEFDPIRVDRIAPDDATAIRAGGAEATLKGIQFNSFGAFFSRAYRENDYLWGRLHGAERLIDIVLSTLPANMGLKPGRTTAIKRAAFLAILDEEQPKLTAIPGLFNELRREIG